MIVRTDDIGEMCASDRFVWNIRRAALGRPETVALQTSRPESCRSPTTGPDPLRSLAARRPPFCLHCKEASRRGGRVVCATQQSARAQQFADRPRRNSAIQGLGRPPARTRQRAMSPIAVVRWRIRSGARVREPKELPTTGGDGLCYSPLFSRRAPSRSGCQPYTSEIMKPFMRRSEGALSLTVDL